MDEPGSESVSMRGVIAGIIAAVVGPFVYFGLYAFLKIDQLTPVLLIGPLVGLAVRTNTKIVTKQLAVFATVITLISCLAGFVWVDYVNWKPFILVETIRRLFSLLAICAIGLSVMITWWIVNAGGRHAGDDT